MEDRLAIDVGMHTGEDTTRLLDAGYRVVGVEANPELVLAATDAFRDQIADGRLTIVNAAIAEERGTVPFGITENTVWGSIDPAFIARNEAAGSTYRYVDVEAVPFEDILAQHGIPHYLKVDIEGLDMLCVRALRAFAERPAFLSIESHVTTMHANQRAILDELAELHRLGYRRFRYVAQDKAGMPQHDCWDFQRWHHAGTLLAQAQALRARQNLAGYGGRWSASLPGKIYRRLRGEPPWFDLHAAYGT